MHICICVNPLKVRKVFFVTLLVVFLFVDPIGYSLLLLFINLSLHYYEKDNVCIAAADAGICSVL